VNDLLCVLSEVIRPYQRLTAFGFTVNGLYGLGCNLIRSDRSKADTWVKGLQPRVNDLLCVLSDVIRPYQRLNGLWLDLQLKI
jgi:hypothetical protein